MKANLKQIRKNRQYSEEFKKEIVQCFESGQFSVVQLEKLYGIKNLIQIKEFLAYLQSIIMVLLQHVTSRQSYL